MPPLTLLIKPVSGLCNMQCEYCFYADEARNRTITSYGVMNTTTLENVVRKGLETANHQCTFAFQGGEPTLAGLDFYGRFIEIVNRYKTKRLQVLYTIQTNGYIVNREWSSFLAENRFLVGLSLDGIKDLHDLYRKDTRGKGTFSKVMRTVQLFDHYHVEYNILTTVTDQTAKNIGRIYGFYDRNNIAFQQYIPCLDPLHEERGKQPYSLTPEVYSKFLCSLFDLWYNDFTRGKKVSIRYFDNLLQMMMGYPPESCGFSGQCSRQIVVEADGGVYPCDFYVMDAYKLGNLNDNSLQEIESKRNSLGFIENSRQVSSQCQKCRWYPLCLGGCRRDRETMCDGKLALNHFCLAYNSFFNYSYTRLVECARNLSNPAFTQNTL